MPLEVRSPPCLLRQRSVDPQSRGWISLVLVHHHTMPVRILARRVVPAAAGGVEQQPPVGETPLLARSPAISSISLAFLGASSGHAKRGGGGSPGYLWPGLAHKCNGGSAACQRPPRPLRDRRGRASSDGRVQKRLCRVIQECRSNRGVQGHNAQGWHPTDIWMEKGSRESSGSVSWRNGNAPG